MTQQAQSTPLDEALPNKRLYLGYVLGVFLLIDILKVADKLILGIIIEPLKAEFHLSDTQLGLLSGFAFAVVYSLFGLPLARWADTGKRTTIISLCVAAWSAATALCGLAANFFQLLAARIGVAIGESGLTPAAHSMISDLFGPTQRGRALAIYSLGSAFGTFLGISFGGYVAGAYGWRESLFALGAPGLVLAALFFLTVREPRRGAVERSEVKDEPVPVSRALAFVWSVRSYRYLVAAASAHLFVTYAFGTWLVPFFLRSHDVSLSALSLSLGPIIAIFGGIGALLGGFSADRLGRSDLRWYVFVPALSVLVVMPLSVAMYIWPSYVGALLLAAPVAIFNAVWQAPVFAIIQTLSPVRMRATAVAVFIFFINLVGYGAGPVVVGALSDAMTPDLGAHALRWVMAGLSLVGFPLAALFYFLASNNLREDVGSLTRGHSART